MFIHDHRKQWPVRVMCTALEVHPSGYYAWSKRPAVTKSAEECSLVLDLRTLHRKSKCSSGSRRLSRELKAAGRFVGRHKVRRLMREDGLHTKRTLRRHVETTNSNHSYRIAPNVLERNFHADEPNQKWCADFTYIDTLRGFVYLAVVMDLFSRRIIGWYIAEAMTQELTITAMKRAMKQRKYPKRVIVHSDRGSQYAADDYRATLREFDGIASMSRKGDPWDNAPMESFFATLKTEGFQDIRFRDLYHVQTDALQYIENVYNRNRLHSTLGYSTPVQFERAFFQHQQLTKQSVYKTGPFHTFEIMHLIPSWFHLMSASAGHRILLSAVVQRVGAVSRGIIARVPLFTLSMMFVVRKLRPNTL